MIGERVTGNYLVRRQLGKGGMGEVFVADHETLDKRLAVKVLLPEFSRNEQVVARFLAEAKAASALKHENIIEIVDYGQLPGGEFYLSMEYLDGYGLDQAQLPLSIENTLQILAQVASALQAAHERGIIHRDVKPANIFIAPKPRNPLFVKLLDFGIAKLNDTKLAGNVETQSQQAIGTPHYMAPEQMRAKYVDHRADIWALGVIAYELSTGRRPYTATSIGDIVLQQHDGPPPGPCELRGDLPQAWGDVVLACLSVKPDHRPQSAQDVGELLAAATPNGEALARAVGFEIRGDAALPVPKQTPSGKTVTRNQRPIGPQGTTLGGSARQTQPRAEGPRRAWALPVALLAILGIGGVAVELLAGSGGEHASSAAASIDAGEAATAETDDGAVVEESNLEGPEAEPEAAVAVTVETEPTGAVVIVDGEELGPSLVTLTRAPGASLLLQARHEGFEDGSERLTVPEDETTVRLTLSATAEPMAAKTEVEKPRSASSRRRSSGRRPSRDGRTSERDRRKDDSAPNDDPAGKDEPTTIDDAVWDSPAQ